MAENGEADGTTLIGDTAGKVWHYLSDNGAVTFAKLASGVDEPRDVVMQSVGWLAREGKISILTSKRTKTIQLR